MVPNRIRDMRVQAGLSQEDVADSLPNEVTRVIVSFLEGGKVLPTVESMKGLCDLFICSPTDLYDPGELDLALAETYPDVVARPPAKKGGGRGAGHEGMTEFRVWVKPEEKAALESAVPGEQGSSWHYEDDRPQEGQGAWLQAHLRSADHRRSQ